MAEDLLDHWIRILRPLFPKNAWMVGRISREDHVIQIDWRLESNPNLPQKRSRKIEITIQEEAVDVYLNKTKSEQALSEINMKNWITEKYMTFDPEPDTTSYKGVSMDRWRISKEVLG